MLALWGISAYFGAQQALSQAGHLVGHVSNDGGVRRRVSNCTPVPLGYHADNADLVLLACRSQAKRGGEPILYQQLQKVNLHSKHMNYY